MTTLGLTFSLECKSIISRMLVVDPKERASLQEIMNHPWMTKGFNAPPDNYLPHREPLQLPLDPEVIDKMQGFDFGSSAYITEQLTRIIESDEYRAAVRRYMKDEPGHVAASGEKKRGVFDFYKRRNSISREGLTTPSSEAIRGYDPVNAYSPLISIYYLAREKRDRERRETNPGALQMPLTPGDAPLHLPGLPTPEAAYTNTFAPEMPGEKVTGGRSRPRARTNGEEDVVQGMKNLDIPDRKATQGTTAPPSAFPPPDQPHKREGTAIGLLRRFSTRRYRDRDLDRPQPPTLNIQPPQDSAAPPRKSFSVRRSRRRDPSPATVHGGGSQPQHDGLLSASGGVTTSNKFLGRSTSVNSAEYRPRRLLHRGVPEAVDSPRLGPEPPPTSGSDHSSVNMPKARRGVELTDKMAPNASPLTTPRTLTATRTKSLGHARQESIQARRRRYEEARRDREANNVPEETDADLRDGVDTPAVPGTPGAEISRPAGLKGLFSTATTSSKPPEFIRHDIIRVLNQLGVQYTVIRGGFSCRHAPSINLDDVKDYTPLDDEKSGRVSTGHQRRISFGGAFRGKEKEELKDERLSRPSTRRRYPDQSFVTNSEGSEEFVPPARHATHDQPRDMAATTTRVQDDTGERLVLKFEISIVKIPLLSLHGIQFKKVQGGMNQYRSMTSAILNALRL